MIKFVISIFMICNGLSIGACESSQVEEPPLYFWDARPTQGFSNFGDALSEALTERVVGHKVRVTENPLRKKITRNGIYS